MNLIDFDYGPGDRPGGYWHTEADTLDKVCPASLETVGETALVAIPASAEGASLPSSPHCGRGTL